MSDELNFNIPFNPIRPDNIARGKDNADKIAKTVKSLYQDPDGPYFEHYIGRPSMDRTNLGNNIKDVVVHSNRVKEGMAEYMKTEEYKLGKIENGKKHMIPCYHNDIKYNSLKEAAKVAGVTTSCLRNWIKNNKNGWKR
jgi:hypothetical protein